MSILSRFPTQHGAACGFFNNLLTKTRLIPALGARLAARLQRRLSEAVVQVARQFTRAEKMETVTYLFAIFGK